MRIHLITGPPCSGKTTFARAHANPRTDIIIDMDALRRALGAPDRTPWWELDTPNTTDRAALRLRSSAIKFTNDNPHHHGTTWLIDTDGNHPHYHERTDLDPGQAECHRRADDDGRPPSTHTVIDAWYRNHPTT